MPTKQVSAEELKRELLIALGDKVSKKLRKEVEEVVDYYLKPCPLTDSMPGSKWPYSMVKAASEDIRKAEDKLFFDELMKEANKPLLEDAARVADETFLRLISEEIGRK